MRDSLSVFTRSLMRSTAYTMVVPDPTPTTWPSRTNASTARRAAARLANSTGLRVSEAKLVEDMARSGRSRHQGAWQLSAEGSGARRWNVVEETHDDDAAISTI
jgi:hypothetical protein